ncbi:MAG: tRNA (adenosine(37)-N6)-threonylcarbamoyltransferase complex ATPase subunit type 1 TsaE [Thiomargarita sp.]|nr:tRNA (adenosine(37)-N6)-threonylcarbamoyltransferase complex ATPase subunit type 1 TsaE [Thiomargarita sp.]
MIIPTANAMAHLGHLLAKVCPFPCICHLGGDLGVGKTTLVRGFLHGMGYTGIVKSPTYTLVESYPFDQKTIFHFDFYRLGDPEELEYMGIREYFKQDTICLIEWPEKGNGFTPPPDIYISISHDADTRIVDLHAHSEPGKVMIKAYGVLLSSKKLGIAART